MSTASKSAKKTKSTPTSLKKAAEVPGKKTNKTPSEKPQVRVTGKTIAGKVVAVEQHVATSPQDFYYDYVGPSGSLSHVSERLPRAVLRYVQRIAARARINGAEIAARHDLHVTDMYVLMVLQRSPDFSAIATDLKSALSYTSGGMTKRIDRLEQQKLVERVSHPTDRRAWIIRLTDDGFALAKKIDAEGRTNGIRTKISSVFDEKEWELFAGYLQRLDRALEAAGLGASTDETTD